MRTRWIGCILAAVCLAYWPAPAAGQVKAIITGPARAKVDVPIFLSGRKSAGAITYAWRVTSADGVEMDATPLNDAESLVTLTFPAAGTYRVELLTKGKPLQFPGKMRHEDNHYTDEYVDWLQQVIDGRLVLNAESTATLEVVVTDLIPPGPPNPYPAPAAETAEKLGPVLKFRLTRTDADQLANLFHAQAVKIRTADGRPPTTAEVAASLAAGGKALNLKDKYPGLGTALDEVQTPVFAGMIRPATAADADLLEGLAWALFATGGGAA